MSSSRRRRATLRGATAAVLASSLAITACVDDAPDDVRDSASDAAASDTGPDDPGGASDAPATTITSTTLAATTTTTAGAGDDTTATTEPTPTSTTTGTPTAPDTGPTPPCRPPERGEPVPWDPTDVEASTEIRPASDDRPGLQVVEYAVPDRRGAPWSQWGQGVVLPDGRLLSAVGDHRGVDGRSYVYVFDPASGELSREIDVQEVVGHVRGTTGFGKIHAPMVTGPCGEIYVATYWGARDEVAYGDDYRGDVLLRIDPVAETVTDLGVIHPGHGVASMAISPDGSLLYVEAARPEPAGTGSFVVIDLASGETVFEDDDDRHTGYRSIAVDDAGRAHIAWGAGRLARYDPSDNRLRPIGDPIPGGGVLRWATAPLPDGSIVAVTTRPNHFFRIEPEGDLTDLGPAPGYVTSLASAPDGSSVYFAPGARGADEVSGTIWRLDPGDGRQSEVLDVAALADERFGVRMGGSYNIALDATTNRLFVGFNAGDDTTDEDNNFARVFLAVVDLPGAAPAAVSLTCWSAPAGGAAGDGPAFVDRTEAFGLVEPLTGMRAHAVAVGDVDGDDWLDLVVGTFATARPEVYQERGARRASPDRLLTGGPDGFTPGDRLPDALGRTSGAALVDLDNDGVDELVLSRNVRGRDTDDQAVSAIHVRTSDGWEIVDSGLDTSSSGRSIGVLDVDRDGLLDLVIAEDRYTGGSSRLYLNQGALRFAEAGEEVGWPADVEGFGVATGDLDRDGWTDLFVAGSNRMFVSGPDGLREVNRGAFDFETFGDEDVVTGADIGDLDGDGWPDLVVGHHFNSTVDDDTEVPVRVYRNTTGRSGATPRFTDVTDRVGSVPLPTKAPHVQIADVDNDGHPDIVTSASAEDGTRPAVLRNTGGPELRFAAPAGLGSDQYWVAAPAVDLDRDGRLDVVAIEWEPALPSRLFVNDSAGGHWLEVSLDVVALGEPAVGAVVEVFELGRAGDDDALVGRREIVATTGYTAGVAPVAHVGLGERTAVDVVVTTPSGRVLTAGVDADAHVRFPAGCG